MDPAHAPSVYTGGANVIAVLILLLEFGMLRQALVRDQIRLYAAQAGLISVLAVIVGAVHHLPELYVLAALSAALKVVVIPLVLGRLLRGDGPGAPVDAGDIAGSGGLGLAATVLLATALPRSGSSPRPGSRSRAAGRRPPPCRCRCRWCWWRSC